MSSKSSGSRARRATTSGSPAALAVASMGAYELTEKSVGVTPIARSDSMVTIESLPPPTATSGRTGSETAGAPGASSARSGASIRGRSACGTWLR
ncbi:hypothetical protein [Nocardioides daphniae]|uniref:Uncharacterized protein n=1 Tax=Nocardioides daphniae TaxID=402297 RepID=A0A4P7UC48_9ACTN|nr:hypothetical protein [Nocardioides daphniae]QCC77772.1 hypothetical protein E2C04_12305 [Nocardioides daphniae]